MCPPISQLSGWRGMARYYDDDYEDDNNDDNDCDHQVCKTDWVKQCEDRTENVCIDVTETICEVSEHSLNLFNFQSHIVFVSCRHLLENHSESRDINIFFMLIDIIVLVPDYQQN